jgi:hypothetical protein
VPPEETVSPTSLADARRERERAPKLRAAPELPALPAEAGPPYVAAADVVALLNRIGECVRALPSFGRTRTQTAAVVAKRTLSAISTCSSSVLPDEDELRPVLARLEATRSALRGSILTGAERIAISRWMGQLDHAADAGAGTDRSDRGLPTRSYLLFGGQVVSRPRDPRRTDGAHDDHESIEERIDDLARAGALIAAEIDRLQQLADCRYA